MNFLKMIFVLHFLFRYFVNNRLLFAGRIVDRVCLFGFATHAGSIPHIFVISYGL